MTKLTETFKKVIKNKVLHYVLSRYATYFIQFINSIFIAVYLGPYYLGIWGFITLIIQYLNQINLGIAHSVNAIIAIHKNKEWYVQKVIGTSITMLVGLSFLAILFFTFNEWFSLNLGDKYNFSMYAPAVAAIGILGYFNTLFSGIFRVYGRVIEIAINQSAFPVLMLITIFLFKGENLLWALVGANFVAFLLSFGLYLVKTPVKLTPLFIGKLVKTIQIKGWHLFVYNTSFYLIIISTKTFVSAYYSVEEFGYFTFAFALANVVLLLLQSFSFLIYPKLLNRLASASTEKIVELLSMVRDAYITSSHLLVHLAILIFPLFLLLFPQYNQSSNAFKLIALTVVLYTNSFGYSGLLIAKNYEKKLGTLSFFALILNISIAFILVKIMNVPFSYIILATLLTYIIYLYLLGKMTRRMMKLSSGFIAVLKDVFPLRMMIPFIVSFFFVFFSMNNNYFIFPLLLFIALNYKKLITNNHLKELILSPRFIDI